MGDIEVIGLGAGTIDQLPLGIYKKLMETNNTIYARTREHPVVDTLEREGVTSHSFDYIYKRESTFVDVYHHITTELLRQAENGNIIYAVPGHPMLAEQTVAQLLEIAGGRVRIGGGTSYLDDLFTALQIDPIEGLQFVDATSFRRKQLNYRNHIVFCQVYDSFMASEVKLELLEDLPPDYQVVIVKAAGSRRETVTSIMLEDLDRTEDVSNLTSIYVPPVPSDLLNHTFIRLREVIAQLRSPDGCPWDRKQTHESLRAYAIEEVHEFIEAVDLEDDAGMVEELGDLLLQVMLHSQIGADDGYFTVDDVIGSITEKMIRRHPHVFQDAKADSAAAVTANWEEIKRAEKGDSRNSVFSGIPKSLPALAKAAKIQEKAERVLYTEDDLEGIWKELIAKQQALDTLETSERKEETIGEALFALVELSRYYNVNPELALANANQTLLREYRRREEENE